MILKKKGKIIHRQRFLSGVFIQSGAYLQLKWNEWIVQTNLHFYRLMLREINTTDLLYQMRDLNDVINVKLRYLIELNHLSWHIFSLVGSSGWKEKWNRHISNRATFLSIVCFYRGKIRVFFFCFFICIHSNGNVYVLQMHSLNPVNYFPCISTNFWLIFEILNWVTAIRWQFKGKEEKNENIVFLRCFVYKTNSNHSFWSNFLFEMLCVLLLFLQVLTKTKTEEIRK